MTTLTTQLIRELGPKRAARAIRIIADELGGFTDGCGCCSYSSVREELGLEWCPDCNPYGGGQKGVECATCESSGYVAGS